MRYPGYHDCTRMLAQALQALRAEATNDPLVTGWTTAELRGIVHDYLRCRAGDARIGSFRRTLRSLTSRSCLRHDLDGRSLRIQIGPARRRRNGLRATLSRRLTERERIRSIRIVRVQEGFPRACPTQWEPHISVEGPANAPAARRARPRVTAVDLGGRATATSDHGQGLQAIPAAAAESRTLARAMTRKLRGSNARRRVRARLRKLQDCHAQRRRQRIVKHAAIMAREHAIVAVEDLDHRGMRRKGGRVKRGINRSLAGGSPGLFVAALQRKLDERGGWLVPGPAAWTSRQCIGCGTRSTRLTRTRVQCRVCGTSHDRDHAAAANILLRGIAIHAAAARTQSGPSGSAETAQKRRLPASE